MNNLLLLAMSASDPAGALGPGPQELIGGDMTDGFFGETLASDLITGGALYTALGMTGGTVVAANVNEPWLKFAIDGKIVYYAKKAFRSGIAKGSMSNAMNKTLTIQGKSFKVGLPIVKDPNSSVAFTAGVDTPYSYNSEWNRLMYRITAATAQHPKTSQVGANWAEYQPNEVWVAPSTGLGVACWTNEVVGAGRVWRGNDGISSSGNTTTESTVTGYGWRPRLELVP